MPDFVRPHRWQPTKLPCPWDSPGKNTGMGFHFLLQCMKVKGESGVAQSCRTLSDPMDCSLPGSSVHGIFQARVLEWDFPGKSTGVPLPSPVIREWSATVVADGLIAIHTLFKQYRLRALRGILMNLHKDSIRCLILFLVLFIFKISIYIQISSKVIYLHQKYYSMILQLLAVGAGVINVVFSGNSALVAQMVKNLHVMQETRVQPLDQADPLVKGMATHYSTLAWRIPCSLEGFSPWSHKELDMTETVMLTKPC